MLVDELKIKRQAFAVFLGYSVASRAFMTLVFTVNMIYFVVTARLNPLQMVLVGTTLELAIFLFELPTGVVADTVSRKLSVIIGVFLIGAGFLLQAFAPLFGMILAAQVLWGVGYTFTSGAFQAWITEEIGEENAASAFLKATQWEQIGALAAVALSVLTAAWWGMQVPMVLGGLLFFVLGIFLILFMKEHNFSPAALDRRRPWQSMKATLQSGVKMLRVRPVLVRILLIGFFYGLYSEGLDRLWVPHVLERYHLPEQGQAVMVGWIGGLNAVSMLITFFAAAKAHEFFEKHPSTRLKTQFLTLLSILLVLSLAFFAVIRLVWVSFFVLILIAVLRELIYPLYTAWVNQRLNSDSRATVLSMSSLVDALGQIGGGPLVGLVAQNISIQTGLLFSAVLLSPVIGLLFFNRNERE
jgi:DHA3 family tetracycline resistance protein-like MFS transporter